MFLLLRSLSQLFSLPLCRRALKATAVLVPLFGLQLVAIIYRPPHTAPGAETYEMISVFVTNSQVCVQYSAVCYHVCDGRNNPVCEHVRGTTCQGTTCLFPFQDIYILSGLSFLNLFWYLCFDFIIQGENTSYCYNLKEWIRFCCHLRQNSFVDSESNVRYQTKFVSVLQGFFVALIFCFLNQEVSIQD